MVNIRASVARAIEAGVIGAESGDRLIRSAKETFYQERSLVGAMDRTWGPTGNDEAVRFRRFIERGGFVDQKRLDALELLRRLSGSESIPRAVSRGAWNGETGVNRSTFIQQLHHDVTCRPFTRADRDLPGGEQVALEARLLGPRYRLLRRLAQLMSMAEALARGRRIAVTPHHLARVFKRDDFGLGPDAPGRRWTRTHDLDSRAMKRFVWRLATLRALLDAAGGTSRRRGERQAGYEPYLLALMRIEGRYQAQRAKRRDGEEFQLLRRIAKLWRVVDEVARENGVEPLDEPQVLADEFRRARGLDSRKSTRDWMQANDLHLDDFTRLVVTEARLSALRHGSRCSTLGFANAIEPVCWLLDAIRLSGFYPSLKRRIASQSGQEGWRQSEIGLGASFERTLRDHCARVGDPVPENVEEYARSLDFEGGVDELVAALERDSSNPHGA